MSKPQHPLCWDSVDLLHGSLGPFGPKVGKRVRKWVPGPLGPGAQKFTNRGARESKSTVLQTSLTLFQLRFRLFGPRAERPWNLIFGLFFQLCEGPKWPLQLGAEKLPVQHWRAEMSPKFSTRLGNNFVELSGFLGKFWRMPDPPGANPLVAERAPWRSSQSRVTYWKSLQIPVISSAHLATPVRP